MKILPIALAGLVLAPLLCLGGCTSSTDGGPDPREGLFGTEASGFGNPLLIWQGNGRAEVQVTEGQFRCRTDPPGHESVRWYAFGSDGRLMGWGRWEFGEVQCEFSGPAPTRITYITTGETLTTSPDEGGGDCVRLRKELPGRETWEAGTLVLDYGSLPEEFGLPPELALPDTMPRTRYRDVRNCPR